MDNVLTQYQGMMSTYTAHQLRHAHQRGRHGFTRFFSIEALLEILAFTSQ